MVFEFYTMVNGVFYFSTVCFLRGLALASDVSIDKVDARCSSSSKFR